VESLYIALILTIVMRALGLLSGGLDSSLAVKMVLDQGIEVIALKFTSAFCQCDTGGCCHAADLAEKLGIRLISVPKGQDYLDIVRNPKFGRGSGMNACVDCRIYMLKRSKTMADELGAKFIFTGEVVGQRPMSQQRRTLSLIEREAGLEGKLVRPLSAKLLPETEAEKMGWIDRKALLNISGRSRKPQIELAAEKGLIDYPCPAGGCLLTSKEFSSKLRDFLEHNPDSLTPKDVALLKVGRHFRVNGFKAMIGRNKEENDRLRAFANAEYTLMEPASIPGPVCLCEGDDPGTLDLVAAMVARYSDNIGQEVQVRVTRDGMETAIKVLPAEPTKNDPYRIGNDIFPSGPITVLEGI
jgi:tRNA-specific 2-thiouridylase